MNKYEIALLGSKHGKEHVLFWYNAVNPTYAEIKKQKASDYVEAAINSFCHIDHNVPKKQKEVYYKGYESGVANQLTELIQNKELQTTSLLEVLKFLG
jgi:hypothetical protein